eukprot:6179638-Pleurochrysis_carterae.AAC.2
MHDEAESRRPTANFSPNQQTKHAWLRMKGVKYCTGAKTALEPAGRPHLCNHQPQSKLLPRAKQSAPQQELRPLLVRARRGAAAGARRREAGVAAEAVAPELRASHSLVIKARLPFRRAGLTAKYKNQHM